MKSLLSKSNPLRGRKFASLATRFFNRFPFGSSLTSEEFGDWLTEIHKLPKPETRLERLGVAELRKDLIQEIKNAGAHTRRGKAAFALTCSRTKELATVWTVSPPVPRETVLGPTASFIKAKMRGSRYVAEAAGASVPYSGAMMLEAQHQVNGQLQEKITDTSFLHAAQLAQEFGNPYRASLPVHVKVAALRRGEAPCSAVA